MTLQPDSKLTLTARANSVAWWLSGGVLGPTWRFAAAIVVTAGPWLVAVTALAIIALWLQPVLGKPAFEDLNLSVTYAFCLASLVAAPIGVIAARAVRSNVEENQGNLVLEIFLVAAVRAGLIGQLLAILISLALGLHPLGLVFAYVFLSVAAAMLWISFAVLGALRSYRVMIGAFSAGMAVTVGLCLLSGPLQASACLPVWSFAAGLYLAAGLSLAHVSRQFGKQLDELKAAMTVLDKHTWAMRHLGLAVFLAVATVWADKWFFWFGPVGARSAAGFLHFELYDNVMFLAQLSIIPTFAAMFLFNDGEIEQAVDDFRQTMRDHATLSVIKEAVARLCHVVWSGLFRIAFVQASVTIALALFSPFVSGLLNFSLEQLLLLQVALAAVLLQSVGYLACSVLILCSRTRTFLAVQVLFLLVNISCSFLFFSTVGTTAYAVLTSSLFFAALSGIVGYRSLSSYDYLIFLGENDSLYQRV